MRIMFSLTFLLGITEALKYFLIQDPEVMVTGGDAMLDGGQVLADLEKTIQNISETSPETDLSVNLLLSRT